MGLHDEDVRGRGSSKFEQVLLKELCYHVFEIDEGECTMAELKNPFTPVAGKTPQVMVGRDFVIEEMEDVLSGDLNNPAVISLLVGARGTGKTALLSCFANMALQNGWICTSVSCIDGMLDDIVIRTKKAASHLAVQEKGKTLSGFNASISGVLGVGLRWENEAAPDENWRLKMDCLFDLLEETDTGLLITVDEVDPGSSELVSLIMSFQHFLGEGRKAALAMAGLPYNVNSLLAGKATSFLRRAACFHLGPLEDSDVKDSLQRTMEAGGKSFEHSALERAVLAVGGFPFMLQLLGYRSWNLAGDAEIVDLKTVEAAIKKAEDELGRVYDVMWFELSEADKQFIAAMLEDEKHTVQADLSSRLDKSSGHVSKYKKRMLSAGIIQERSKGKLEFCIPGFREYAAERLQEEC